MRLKEYINELKIMYPDKVADVLMEECKPFIDDFIKRKKTFIWRGTLKNLSGPMEKFTPRKNRKPRDMPKYLHDYLDMVFKSEFGWRVRSEGVFVSSDKSMAKDFSESGDDAYLFFPIGRYKYVWSPVVKDIYTWLGRSMMTIYYFHDGRKSGSSSWFSSEDMFDTPGLITRDLTYAFEKRDVDEIRVVFEEIKDERDMVLYKWKDTNENASLSAKVTTILTGIINAYKEYIMNSIPKYYSDKNFNQSLEEQELAFKCKEYYLVHGGLEEQIYRYIRG